MNDFTPLTDVIKALGFTSAIKATKSAVALADPAFDMDSLNPYERETYERTYQKVLADTNGDAVKAELAARGAINRIRYGMAVKSANFTEDAPGTYVAGWAVMYGSPAVKDLDDTWFGPNTDYFLPYYEGAVLWYMHGDDPEIRSEAIGHRVKTQVHEHGIWIVHKLHEEHPAFEAIVEQVKTGKLSYSSDSLSHHVSKGYRSLTGELTVWPLSGVSLVDRPAEIGLGEVVLGGNTNE